MSEAARSEVDSFGTFLETVRHETETHSSIGEIAPKLLAVLGESGSQDARQLLNRTGVAVTDFAQALKTLIEADLVRIKRAGDDEIVELTERGSALT